jgi:hypothetical protein
MDHIDCDHYDSLFPVEAKSLKMITVLSKAMIVSHKYMPRQKASPHYSEKQLFRATVIDNFSGIFRRCVNYLRAGGGCWADIRCWKRNQSVRRATLAKVFPFIDDQDRLVSAPGRPTVLPGGDGRAEGERSAADAHGLQASDAGKDAVRSQWGRSTVPGSTRSGNAEDRRDAKGPQRGRSSASPYRPLGIRRRRESPPAQGSADDRRNAETKSWACWRSSWQIWPTASLV